MPLDLDVQDSWEPDHVRLRWPVGIATDALTKHLWSLPIELTATGASGRVLEVAAAEAVHSCHVAARGFSCTVVEPSPRLIAKARQEMAGLGVHVDLVRAIGEGLPFPTRRSTACCVIPRWITLPRRSSACARWCACWHPRDAWC